MDKIMSTISDLKSDNERLKQDNIDLKQQVTDMQQKLDITENQSRRNNLKIHGIPGTINEQWDTTEQKLREFMKNTLGL
ncbi:hypothetical protein DPMN_112555 [Dreissena polymorpha]|uniref:Uncharacterized protein n=1 Tax=Dreissena polymorpha TaxID=45954 RepID=A0A9D4QQR5_DREPO|nr:hypothetical protein DPMN_112555 [Dreissena polymorpha]